MTATAARPGGRAVADVRGHLHQVDVVRLLTFASVIAVHAIWFTNPTGSVGANALLMLLHFTREAFFAITAFVLFHVYYHRPYRLPTFWRRRYYLVGVPYLVWTIIYFPFSTNLAHATAAGAALQFGHDLITGAAAYHLYFLLVSLQVYAVFPLFVRLVRRTEGHHRELFVASLLVELAMMVALGYFTPSGGSLGILAGHAFEYLPTYEFYLVAGALAAVHLPELQRWVDDRGRLIAVLTVASGLAAEGMYFGLLHGGWAASDASNVLQPVMVIWSAAITLGLYKLGSSWARRRTDNRTSRWVGELSLASFGVYLVHPLVLNLLMRTGLGRGAGQTVPGPLAAVTALMVTAVVSVAFTELMLRTPIAVALTGRPRKQVERPAQTAPDQAPLGAGDLPAERQLARRSREVLS